MLRLVKIPWMLVVLRFAIVPLLLVDALDGSTGIGFLSGYIIAVLSDLFDGIICPSIVSEHGRTPAGRYLGRHQFG